MRCGKTTVQVWDESKKCLDNTDKTAQQDVDEAVCTLKDAMDHLGTAAYKKDEMLKK